MFGGELFARISFRTEVFVSVNELCLNEILRILNLDVYKHDLTCGPLRSCAAPEGIPVSNCDNKVTANKYWHAS